MRKTQSLLMISWVLLTTSYSASANPLVDNSASHCTTQVVVTTPQTVSFYVKKISGLNYLGTASSHHALHNTTHCLKQSPVMAVVWDDKGEKQVFKTKRTYNHQDKAITLSYPADFAGAPHTTDPVLCQVRIFNNSDDAVTFYAGKARLISELGEVQPHQSFNHAVPCFSDEHLLARVTASRGNWVYVQRYKTLTTYTDINHQPVITFPQHFARKKDTMEPMHRYWLSLLD